MKSVACEVTLTTVLPSFKAVIFPLLSTETTVGSSAVNTIAAPDAVAAVVAVTLSVSPSVRFTSSLSNARSESAFSGALISSTTFTAIVAVVARVVLPAGTETVRVALPTCFAVRVVPLTSATFAFSVVFAAPIA